MENALHIQINDHDTYHSRPSPLDQLCSVPKVPIIRIYGSLRVSTPTNLAYNVLVHVHNFYPYLYLDWWGTNESVVTQKEIDDFQKYLEECIKTSFQRNKEVDSDFASDDDEGEHDASDLEPRYIASIILCKGTPIYGYHIGYSTKIKVSFLSPLYKTRFFRLINEKKIDFGKFFASKKRKKPFYSPNVYEAHINLLTQFMTDFNLYGCGWLEISSCYFRSPVVNSHNLSIDPLKTYLKQFISPKNVLSSETFPRMGRCLIEFDISTHHIVNRQRLRQSAIHNDFAEFNNPHADSVIYLSSLESTFNELKYQCSLRGATQTTQLLTKSYSQVFKNIGKRRFQKWDNNDRHLELLRYVKKLNNPSSTSNVNDYYEKVIRPALKNESLQTTFDVVSNSSYSNLTGYNPNVERKHLKIWRSYDGLFKLREQPARMSSISTPSLVPAEEKLPLNIEDNVSEVPNEEDSSSDDESEADEQDLLYRERSSVTEESISQEPNSIALDEQLFALTQLKQVQSLTDEKMNASDQMISQSSDSLVRHAYELWEFMVPSSLSKNRLKQTMRSSGILDIDYPDPSYYSEQDIHPKPLVFANKKIVVPFKGKSSAPPVDFKGYIHKPLCAPEEELIASASINSLCRTWEFVPRPPSKEDVIRWVNVTEKKKLYKANRFRSQIEPAVTQTNDFKYSHRVTNLSRNPSGYLSMTLFYMEIHADTQSDLCPDPNKNPISMIIYRFDDSNHMFGESFSGNCIFLSSDGHQSHEYQRQLKNVSSTLGIRIQCFESEMDMIEQFLQMIDFYDPDILAGYEINSSSWGYLVERMRNVYQVSILSRLSRTTMKGNGKFGDKWGYTHTSAIKVNGRHMLNLWRILRSELSLTSYSIENVCFHLLHRSMPRFSNLELSAWRNSGKINEIVMFCRYYNSFVDTALQVLESQEIVIKNVEQSRLIGIDFTSNFYRGSQYKVESILIRIAKSENILLNSPSKQQVHEMRALNAIPLIMEPDSNFYKSPLVVLDFQSLYPSIMIAYNYCYSTLIGKIEGFEQSKNSVGYLGNVNIPLGLVDILDKNDGINISPNGLLFASTKFRKSILSKMLQEILNMRINTKAVASAFPDDSDLNKVCNSKQLALKLIANVTYGYTSATFSGRMPNSDIADAIVSTGREILAKSIEIIETSEFNAKVVYGDTDSLFVYFPGRSKEDAFKFGKLLAQRVTDFFPDPVKLKFEKVYHPCVLLAKKRYVGNCFEFEDQITPKFEAKGIETIRRDGIPAQQKMVGKTIRILFETKNLSSVKEYVVKQFYKIIFNQVNVKDFSFAKEVRYGTYKNQKYLPPGAILAENAVKKDPRSEPQYRERIPYLVIKDPLKERIKDRSVSPETYLESLETGQPLELDYEYYITRVLIPPLERVFNLMGVNIKEWYRTMSKSTKQIITKRNDILRIGDTIRRRECFRCGGTLESDQTVICSDCLADKIDAINDLFMSQRKSNKIVADYTNLCKICNTRSFGNVSKDVFTDSCRNIDCLIYYARAKSVMENNVIRAETSKILEELQ